jgi:hypothetical protein
MEVKFALDEERGPDPIFTVRASFIDGILLA